MQPVYVPILILHDGSFKLTAEDVDILCYLVRVCSSTYSVPIKWSLKKAIGQPPNGM